MKSVMPWRRAIEHDRRRMRKSQRALSAVALILALATCIGSSTGSSDIAHLLLWTGLTAAAVWTWASSVYTRDAAKSLPIVLVVMTFTFLENETLPVMVASGTALTLSILAAGWSSNTQASGKTFAMTVARFAGLMLMAVPVGLSIFFIYPRTSLGFNPMGGGQSSKAGMGLSSSMTPGSVSELVQSNKLAFSASFYAETFEAGQLYWRASALNGFDGRTWRQYERAAGKSSLEPGAQTDLKASESDDRESGEAADATAKATETTKVGVKPDEGLPNLDMLTSKAKTPVKAKRPPALQYRVTLPSTLGPYMPLLDSTIRDSARVEPLGTQLTLGPSGAYGVQGIGSTGGVAIQVTAVAAPSNELVLSSPPNSEDTALPAGGNPKTRQMAKEWATEAEGKPQAIIDLFARHVRSNEYHYTLKPPIWKSKDGIDDFFFGNKRGFCEHYASTFVYFMRAAGVPARVISGFQGGDVDGSEVRVLARDAHAWAEVWIEGKGWKRVDPTTFIDPSRVEAQTRSMLERSIGLGALTQAWASKLEAAWNETILYYNGEAQMALFDKWLSNPMALFQKICGVILALLTGFVALRLAVRWWARRGMSTETKAVEAFQQMVSTFSAMGCPVSPAHSPGEAARILMFWAGAQEPRDVQDAAGFSPIESAMMQAWVDQSIAWIESYEEARYSVLNPKDAERRLRDLVRHARIFQKWHVNGIIIKRMLERLKWRIGGRR